MFKHFLNPPNWFTSASIFCGFYAILLASGEPHQFYKAGLMICFAGVFDSLDGRVARLTGRGSDFGIQLDSLADVVSFGIAPAILVWFWALRSLGWLGLLGAFAFALCGAMRLARFNTAADGAAHATSEGLTITMAGGTLATMVMAHDWLGRAFVAHPMNPFWITLALGLLMVSTIPFRTFKTVRRRPAAMIGLALFLGAGITLGVVYDISIWLFATAAIYAASGPFESLLHLRSRRHAAGHGITIPFHDDDG